MKTKAQTYLRFLKSEKASSLIWSMMMSIIIIMIVSSLLIIVIKSFRQTQGITSSVRAYMAAEFASERALNYIYGAIDHNVAKTGSLEQDGSPSYSFNVNIRSASCLSDYCLIAQGHDGGVTRKIEGEFSSTSSAQGYVGNPSGGVPTVGSSVDYFQAIPAASMPKTRFVLKGDINTAQAGGSIYELGILDGDSSGNSNGWGMGIKIYDCGTGICIVPKKIQAQSGSIYGIGSGDGNPYVSQGTTSNCPNGICVNDTGDAAGSDAIKLSPPALPVKARFELTYRWSGQPTNSTTTLKVYQINVDGSLTCKGIKTVLNYGNGDTSGIDIQPRRVFLSKGTFPVGPPWFNKSYTWDGVKKVRMYNVGGNNPLDIDNFWWQNY